MNGYDADRAPDPNAWLALDEDVRIELVAVYHRRRRRQSSRDRAHAAFHTIVENQLAGGEPAAVEAFARLRDEGLSRHDAVHAIASVLAAHIYDLLKHGQPSKGEDPNKAYAAALRKLTAESWRNAG